MDERVIQVLAHQLTTQHGDKALDLVVQWIEEALEAGNDHGCMLWGAVYRAIWESERQRPKPAH